MCIASRQLREFLTAVAGIIGLCLCSRKDDRSAFHCVLGLKDEEVRAAIHRFNGIKSCACLVYCSNKVLVKRLGCIDGCYYQKIVKLM